MLNLGDCFAYAPARYAGEPLLFKGSDFDRTDVRVGQRSGLELAARGAGKQRLIAGRGDVLGPPIVTPYSGASGCCRTSQWA